MLTIVRYSLARTWGQVLGWGLSLAVLAAYLMGFYDTLAQQQEALQQLLSSYPPEMLAFFGDITEFFTPAGYLNVELFSYLPLILGIYAVLAGSGLVAADEENGTLDLVLAHPVNRLTLFAGRLLAFGLSLLGILVLTWLGLVIGRAWSSLGYVPLELARPFVSLGATLAVFGALALVLSLVLPSRRLAATVGGLALVGAFFLTTLARIDERLVDWDRLSPLHYYQGGHALNGLEWNWILALAAVAVILCALAAWLFTRRDIRVAGEGSWGLTDRLRRRRAAA
jgi:ABC-2 type transport system permease protein